MKKLVVIIFIFLCSFSMSEALVKLNEVMYNPEGSDSNREWIEIYNNGPSVDISSWYFNENDTYHGLYPDGFSNLNSGEYALIVKDIATVKSELGSNVKYIKSSFSLNNSGEAIAIANDSKSIVSSFTYDSGIGGDGDGKSIQFINNSWVSSIPTPGVVNSISNNSYDVDNNNIDNNDNDDDNNLKPYYSPKIELPDVILSKTDFNVKAEVTYINGGKQIKKLGGYYYLNFGDGNILESNKKIDTNYIYKEPGNYIVVFEYYSSRLSFESGEEPDSIFKKNVSVVGNNIKITGVNQQSGVTLKNNTSSIIDISNWTIKYANYKYSFPRNSYISNSSEIDILFSILKFSPIASSSNRVYLLSNSGDVISYFPNKNNKKSSLLKSNLSSKNKSNNIANSRKEEVYDGNFFNNKDSYLEQYLLDNPDKLKVDFGEDSSMVASPYNANTNNSNTSIFYALGSLLLILGIARFTKHSNNVESDNNDFGTIEIIE